ncbi:MAG: hypothetical protein AAFY56_07850 [Pseudomonadota bacterium]
MAWSDADVDAFVEMARDEARAKRDAARPAIIENYRNLVALPLERRAAALRDKADETLQELYDRAPAPTEDNAKVALKNLQEQMKSTYGHLEPEFLAELSRRVATAIREDIRHEVQEIRRMVHGTATHGKSDRTKIAV